MKHHKFISLTVIVFVLIILCIFSFIWSKLDLILFEDEITHSLSFDESITSSDDKSELTPDLEGLENVESFPEIPAGEVNSHDHVTNILVIGTDERTKKFNSNARSDCMILVSLNTREDTVKLVSFERGMGVPVLEGQYEGQYDWLTHIFRYGGSDLLLKTIRSCFKVDVERYVRVNFNSVRQIVDSVGGIDIDLTAAEASHMNQFVGGAAPGKKPLLSAGRNHLDGSLALEYARLRKIDSDWQRITRQRRVIIAMAEQTKNLNLLELNKLADEVLPLIQTNLSKFEIADLMISAPGLIKGEFDQLTIPVKGSYGGMTGMGGRGMFAPDYEVNCKALDEFLYGVDIIDQTN